ncbi:hypothetical protein JG687_00018395 [Phytophthora cactorum]|uniref:Uncharacterized protein n=1 Tax=Phytophthora cactorum TaxID=29920 RepID=A0A8T1TPY0_9STRA|nr:hypothetical protein GQ600_26661 [Phytophthora cactorum]KAG6943528.1 hypothetical protein JG687_00018395 [Phytophthora cactorum]
MCVRSVEVIEVNGVIDTLQLRLLRCMQMAGLSGAPVLPNQCSLDSPLATIFSSNEFDVNRSPCGTHPRHAASDQDIALANAANRDICLRCQHAQGPAIEIIWLLRSKTKFSLRIKRETPSKHLPSNLLVIMKKILLQNKSNEPWLRVQEARAEMNRAQDQILLETFPELTRKSRGSIGVAAAEARIKQRHIRLFCEEITTSIIDTALLALDHLMRTKMILAQNLHAIRNIVVAHNVLLPSS